MEFNNPNYSKEQLIQAVSEMLEGTESMESALLDLKLAKLFGIELTVEEEDIDLPWFD